MRAAVCPHCQSLITHENVIASHLACGLRKWAGRAALVTALAFAGYMAFEYRAWGMYMANHLVLQARAATGVAGPTDWFELGTICRTLGRHSCSENAFANLLEADPQNLGARASLAVAQTELGKFAQALNNFETVFREGAANVEATSYYAMALEGMGRDREAETWYLRVLNMTPRLADITNRVLNLMVKRDAYFEAMSLIGAVSRMVPEAAEYFQPRLHAINDLARKEKISANRMQLRMATVRDHHQLPLKFEGMERPGFFTADTGATLLILSKEFVAANKLWKYKFMREAEMETPDNRVVRGDVVLFPEVQVGPWTLKNVEAFVCEGCALLAGQSVLRNFQMRTESREGVQYLTLRK